DTVLKNIRMNISLCHELQVYAIVLIKTGSIPKTSSGKIQRSACLEAFVKNNLDVISIWSENSFLQ
ncbi:MAG: AMP-dependent synthetase, partial [Dolichospermum sp.]|nr:AMP-dependent synthetase [Dolichospermum sp.]